MERPDLTLILERCNLLDMVDSGFIPLTRDARNLRLTSMSSRIENSGHIKRGEDLTRIRYPVADAIESGKNRRAGIKSGNKRWLVSQRGHYTSPYVNRKDPEPRSLLQNEMKERVTAGHKQAQIYAEEFGLAYIDEPPTQLEQQRDRTLRRTHPGAFDRSKVVTALMMLRNSYPIQYDRARADDEYNQKSAERSRKLKATQVSTPTPSPVTSRASRRKRISMHSCASCISFASSADTFGVGIRKVKGKTRKVSDLARKAASKVPGLRRFGTKKTVHEDFVDAEDFLVPEVTASVHSFSKTERDLEVLERNLRRVSQWMNEVDLSATSQAKKDNTPHEVPTDTSEPLIKSVPKRASKTFTIDAGVVLPTPVESKRTSKEFTVDAGIVVQTAVEQLYASTVASVSQEALVTSAGPPVVVSGAAPAVAEMPCDDSAHSLTTDEFADRFSQSFTPAPTVPAVMNVKRRKRDRFFGRHTFGARV